MKAVKNFLDFERKSNHPMTILEQEAYFRQRHYLRECAISEAKNTPIEEILQSYLNSFYHDGSKENIAKYYTARKKLEDSFECENQE